MDASCAHERFPHPKKNSFFPASRGQWFCAPTSWKETIGAAEFRATAKHTKIMAEIRIFCGKKKSRKQGLARFA